MQGKTAKALYALMALVLLATVAAPAQAQEGTITLSPGETRTITLDPKDVVLDPDFWITFQTVAHVEIRQHVSVWAHWTDIIVQWAHLHAYLVLPSVCVGGVDDGDACASDADCTSPGVCSSGVSITNVSDPPAGTVDFELRRNTTCVGGANMGLACMEDAECPGSTCALPICRGGTGDGNTCSSDATCGGGFCDLNTISLAQDAKVDLPIVGPLDATLPPGCPTCPPRINRFWMWLTQITLIDTWLQVDFWSITRFHFIATESWHFETEGLEAGGMLGTEKAYSIDITNKGSEDAVMTAMSNLGPVPSGGGGIPTLSTWGIFAMVFVLLVGASWVLHRRRSPSLEA